MCDPYLTNPLPEAGLLHATNIVFIYLPVVYVLCSMEGRKLMKNGGKFALSPNHVFICRQCEESLNLKNSGQFPLRGQRVWRSRLPAPFRPKLVAGWGMAGICLIRLAGMVPAFLPLPCGLASENAAHRIAVQWDENGFVREGVFIPRRDTNALLNRLAGGRLFPGAHQAAKFIIKKQRIALNWR